MTIDSLEIVLYTAVFVLPGFAVKEILGILLPPRKERDSSFFMSCIAYSLVNLCLCYWAYSYILLRKTDLTDLWFWVLIIVTTLLGVFLISYIVGFTVQKKITSKVFSSIGLKVLDPSPTAWDHCFSQQKEMLVIVELNDGTVIRGWYGRTSFTSSDPEGRDLFIEKEYDLDESNGTWTPIVGSNGVYIPKDTFRMIRFIGSTEEKVTGE